MVVWAAPGVGHDAARMFHAILFKLNVWLFARDLGMFVLGRSNETIQVGHP